MNKVLSNQKGYTLIESLFVLNLVWILMLIPIFSFQNLAQELQTTLFFEELQSSITQIQIHAVLNQEATKFETRPQAREVTFRVVGDHSNSLNHSIQLPEHLTILGASKEYRFLAGSGNQGNLNKTRFQTGSKTYELGFQLGSGRFELEEID